MIIYKNEANENGNNERIEASVKWYNPHKGYGFLTRGDGSADIMIHFSTLGVVGCAYLKEGDRVICDIGPGKRGLQVIRVIEVKFASPNPRALSDLLTSPFPASDLAELEEIEGVIKWYNPNKMYGFIRPNDGTTEIFLHYSVLYRVGYKAIEPGVRVLAKVAPSERGPEARQIIILTPLNSEEKDAYEQPKEDCGV